MKKIFLFFILLGILFTTNTAFSEIFDSLEDLTPAQKQKISMIYNNYKIKNNELENRISSYTDKIAKIKSDKDKTQDQISLLTAAYERNINTLKNQQEYITKEAEEQYKKIMTESQFNQYKAIQSQVQDSFNKFLQK